MAGGGVPGPRRPWSKRIWELLADGPQEREYVVLEAMKLVPPGIAFRNATNHLRNQRNRYPEAHRPQKSHRREYEAGSGIVVQIGARQYVNQVVGQALRDGRLREIAVDGVAHLELTGNISRRHDDPDYGR